MVSAILAAIYCLKSADFNISPQLLKHVLPVRKEGTLILANATSNTQTVPDKSTK